MEELKLIMQTLMGLGETAKEGFIWWLVIDKLIPTLGVIVCVGGVVGVLAYVARRAFAYWFAESRAIATIREIRSILEIYTYPNSRDDSRILDNSDLRKTTDAVRLLREKILAKEKD
jgi:hypothetical protein